MENIQAWQKVWKDQKIRVDRTLDIWESAVLLPLFQGKNGWEILFEVRSSNIKWQPGDICFPGGHREETDSSLLGTALRETEEELGIPQNQVAVLGPLNYFYAYMGPIIFPFAGILPNGADLHIQKEEVEEIFSVPLQDLLSIEPQTGLVEVGSRRAPGFPGHLIHEVPSGWKKIKNYTIYFYPWKNRVIWGITARILHQFLERVRKSPDLCPVR